MLSTREWPAILVGVAGFILGTVVLGAWLQLGVCFETVFPALLLGLEVGWLYSDPAYWWATHAKPFRATLRWLFGNTKYGTAFGISAIVFWCCALSAVGVEFFLAYHSVLLAESWTGISISTAFATGSAWTLLIVPAGLLGFLIPYIFTLSRDDSYNAAELRRRSWKILAAGIVGGLCFPLTVLLIDLVLCIVALCLAVFALVAIANLATTKHLLVVTVGIIVGSLASLLVGENASSDILMPLLRLGVGGAAGLAAGELVHRFGYFLQNHPWGQAINRVLGPRTVE